ncbi:MAG: 7-cyano-7-deazaguanine synthase [Elusimicrobiota bacterium]
MERGRAVCVLASGGADSAVLLARAARGGGDVYPLFIRCGLAWEEAELHWLKKFLAATARPGLKPLTVLPLNLRRLYGSSHWSLSGRGAPGYRSRDEEVYLPGRNALLLSHSAVFCSLRDVRTILLGTLKGNPFPDASTAFFRHMAAALSAALNFPLSIRAPFSRLSKKQVLALGRGLPWELTFSCLKPRGVRPCGRCNKCAERDKAFRA